MRVLGLFLLFGSASMSLVVPALAQSTSVNPGINDSYLKEGMIVRDWIERLGREGREVYDNRQAIVDRLDLKPGMDVADIGTGTGVHLPFLASKVLPSGKAYAVDIVPKFIAHIEQQARSNDWTNVRPVLCTERSVELPADSVDVAFICNVYHHFEFPKDTLASIHAALRSGGRLILIDYKRIPGESADWMLNHMRAGQEVFESEIKAAGFTKTREVTDLFKDNYFVIFTKSE
jgi:SAM-dependent methyltransferase